MTAVNGDVTHEESGVDDVDGVAVEEPARPTWGELWRHFADSVDHEFPKTLSKTQWATAITAHPDIAIRDCDEAKKLVQDAEGGPIVETAPHSARYVVRDDFDAPI